MRHEFLALLVMMLIPSAAMMVQGFRRYGISKFELFLLVAAFVTVCCYYSTMIFEVYNYNG